MGLALAGALAAVALSVGAYVMAGEPLASPATPIRVDSLAPHGTTGTVPTVVIAPGPAEATAPPGVTQPTTSDHGGRGGSDHSSGTGNGHRSDGGDD